MSEPANDNRLDGSTPLRVLVVDDDPVLRSQIIEGLRWSGHAGEGASDGYQALAACERARFDVIVVDLVMPRKEGLATIVDLRQRWPAARVIAISGCHPTWAPPFLDISRLLGAHGALKKPFSRLALTTLIQEVLGQSDGHESVLCSQV